MATCMVARNLAGWSVSFLSFTAFLFPSSSSFASLASFTEMTAIYAEANMAFKNIRTICNTIELNLILLNNYIPKKSTKRHTHSLTSENYGYASYIMFKIFKFKQSVSIIVATIAAVIVHCLTSLLKIHNNSTYN